ncbi:hypothetical protein HWC07_gp045 [Pantoea phage vB_PagM_LIET2]|uniref:Uncharacterized protein n=1 Tax=Pantoea phage vB_PagM_LIET2 TaxID=2508071 RepID=A0A411AW17_9CAUD|nr:hypothetical protein HWC07_gp045 [Pantoea phage vB_PagM_LIET2]QAX92297.1 hypothetical protein LIET2_gp045 [Pantoea phage vB_PagM_LIET2]UJH95944.1 hypothetical protein [Pantoea phage Nafs113]
MMFRWGRMTGPDAWRECTVFHPVRGGYISESFRYNPNSTSEASVKEIADQIWLRLRSDATEINTFEQRYLYTCELNSLSTIKCK